MRLWVDTAAAFLSDPKDSFHDWRKQLNHNCNVEALDDTIGSQLQISIFSLNFPRNLAVKKMGNVFEPNTNIRWLGQSQDTWT